MQSRKGLSREFIFETTYGQKVTKTMARVLRKTLRRKHNKRMLKGTEKSKATFRDDGHYSETEMGNTEWQYEKIGMLAETKDYFVFVFSPSHAQVYDKSNLTGGTVEEFSSFIKEKTQKEIVFIR